MLALNGAERQRAKQNVTFGLEAPRYVDVNFHASLHGLPSVPSSIFLLGGLLPHVPGFS